MKVTYNHFVITENQSIISDQSDSSEIRNSKSLTETINKMAIDTGIESADCDINEEEGYAINRNNEYLTVITVGDYYDHPIAKMIEDNRGKNDSYLDKKIKELI